MPLVLAGRDAQLAQIRTQLGGVATYGQFIGRIRVETGIRGVGKTSLLKATAGYGQLRFTTPGFAAFVRAETGSQSP